MGLRFSTIWVLICVGISLPPSLSWALDYPPNFAFQQVPQPLAEQNPVKPQPARPVPAAGQPFFDPAYGAILTRVTQGIGLRHEYSRFDPFNADQSMILLHQPATGAWRIYRTQSIPYDQDRLFVREIDLAESRWDPKDPNIIWGLSTEHRTFRVIRMDVQSGQLTIVKDFAQDPTLGPIISSEKDLYRITTKGEGEPSQDLRFWALFLQGTTDDYRLRYIFTWDRQDNRVLGLYKIPAKEAGLLDWVGLSPLGNWVVVGADADSSPSGRTLGGLNLADKELRKFHRLAHATAHADVGLDADGNEVIVMQNSKTDHVDLIPLAWDTQPVTEGNDYKKSKIIPLLRLFYADSSPHGLKSGIHVSCNAPGYAVISTYTPQQVAAKNWLDRSVILVRLSRQRPEVFHLAKIHNTTKSYWEETQATIARDGSKVVWASNWGQDVGKDKYFLMQLDMPPHWQSHYKKAGNR
ncbi:MAG: hypothetical protein AB1473_18675 [Thermodesulfobacteriota bacterium]